jgi:hypothetical protein
MFSLWTIRAAQRFDHKTSFIFLTSHRSWIHIAGALFPVNALQSRFPFACSPVEVIVPLCVVVDEGHNQQRPCTCKIQFPFRQHSSSMFGKVSPQTVSARTAQHRVHLRWHNAFPHIVRQLVGRPIALIPT